jgi:DNA-binding HxlR family transcriptional regulator
MITPKVLAQRFAAARTRRAGDADVLCRGAATSTPLALTLVPVFNELLRWSDAHLDEVHAARQAYDGALDTERTL